MEVDQYTSNLLDMLCKYTGNQSVSVTDKNEIQGLYGTASEKNLTGPIVRLFTRLKELYENDKISAPALGINKQQLVELAEKHQQIDEHMVSIGGRVGQALAIADDLGAVLVIALF